MKKCLYCLLLGLRVSHFNGDKNGGPSDPTQKTLTNFIVSGDVSRKNLGDQSSLGSDASDQHFMNNVETAFSIDSHEIQHYGIRDPLDSNNLQNLDDQPCTFSNNVEVEKIDEPLSSKNADKVHFEHELFIILTGSKFKLTGFLVLLVYG